MCRQRTSIGRSAISRRIRRPGSAPTASAPIIAPSPSRTETTAYHVSLTNAVTGFCWQAVVDDHGQIVRTGLAADVEDPDNPAAAYCREQGATYEIRTLENGQQCGACVFPDGSACKAWDYFHGTCAPGDNLPGS